MQVVLVMFREDGERRSFSITHDLTIIGRREDCDLRIPIGDVSRKHCRLLLNEDGLRVEDLGSSNGTLVNGRRVQESILQAGDRLNVGPVAFTVQIDGQPPDSQLRGKPPSSLDEDEDELDALLEGEDGDRKPTVRAKAPISPPNANTDSFAQEEAEAERMARKDRPDKPEPNFDITLDEPGNEPKDDLVDFEVDDSGKPDPNGQ